MAEVLNGSWIQRIADIIQGWYNLISGPGRDSFGRTRVSNTGQRLDVEFLYDKQKDYFDEITNNGTVTSGATSRDLTFSIANTTEGTSSQMASYPVPYTPGNSQLIDITGTLDNANIAGGTAEVFLRSNVTGTVTEETIPQTQWTTLTDNQDWSKSHIFAMDFQSLKVGSIRYFIVANGVPVQVAQINNDNKRNTGYWEHANLPAYYRLYNTATETISEIGYGNADNAIGFRYKFGTLNASATMKGICCTVKSEGGNDLRTLGGLPRSIDNNVTPITVDNTITPIISIRPKSLFNTQDNLMLSIPKSFELQTNEPIKFALIHNGTLTGASFTDVDTNESSIEYDVSATAITGGHTILSGYLSAQSTGAAAGRFTSNQRGLLGKTYLWDRKGAETGILTLVAIRTTVEDATVFGAISWEEIR